MRKVTFDNAAFFRSHSRRPRGVGRWGFDVSFRDEFEETVFVPHSMAFADAKKWAMAFARDNGFDHVSVAP